MIILVAECQSARISGLDRNFNFKAQSKSASPRTEIEGYLTLISSDTRGKKGEDEGGKKKNARIRDRSLLRDSPSSVIVVFLFHELFCVFNFHYV